MCYQKQSLEKLTIYPASSESCCQDLTTLASRIAPKTHIRGIYFNFLEDVDVKVKCK